MQVTVGRIGRPHGIRGDVVVGVRTDEPESRFAAGSRLDTDPADVGPLTVAGSKWHSGELLVRFEGINDRDAAAELRGTWLMVDSATLARPEDPDEFFDADLVGLSVRTLDGTPVGTVDDVLHSGQDVLVIKSSGGRDIMVPFVKPLVPDVDLKSGTLVINPPEGLLDLESLLSVGNHPKAHTPGASLVPQLPAGPLSAGPLRSGLAPKGTGTDISPFVATNGPRRRDPGHDWVYLGPPAGTNHTQ